MTPIIDHYEKPIHRIFSIEIVNQKLFLKTYSKLSNT